MTPWTNEELEAFKRDVESAPYPYLPPGTDQAVEAKAAVLDAFMAECRSNGDKPLAAKLRRRVTAKGKAASA